MEFSLLIFMASLVSVTLGAVAIVLIVKSSPFFK